MTFHWPQITMIVLIGMEVGLHMANHGKPRDSYNIWLKLIDAAVLVWLLRAGGFFGVMA
jgi:hypothetical protein